jgi:hypothetical protein
VKRFVFTDTQWLIVERL